MVSPLAAIALRFTEEDLGIFEALNAKLGLNRTDIVRLAIRRLADLENIPRSAMRSTQTHGFTDAELTALRAALTAEGIQGAVERLTSEGVEGPESVAIVQQALNKLGSAQGIDVGPGYMIAGASVLPQHIRSQLAPIPPVQPSKMQPRSLQGVLKRPAVKPKGGT